MSTHIDYEHHSPLLDMLRAEKEWWTHRVVARIPIRTGCDVCVEVPRDLTPREARKIEMIIKAMVIETTN